MSHPIHKERVGDWTGHVWRREEDPDRETGYYWSLSYSGDLHDAPHEGGDKRNVPPNLVPDSDLFGSEEEARQALLDEIERRGMKQP